MKKLITIVGTIIVAAAVGLVVNGGFGPMRSWADGVNLSGLIRNAGWGMGGGRGFSGAQRSRDTNYGGCMMGGWGQGNGSGFGSGAQTGQAVTSPDQARKIVTDFVARRNLNLTVGKVTEAEGYYTVEVLTTDGQVYDRLAVDKTNGYIRPLG